MATTVPISTFGGPISSGLITVGSGGSSTAQLTFTPNSGTNASFGMANGGSQLAFFTATQASFTMDGSGINFNSGGGISWTNNTSNPFTTQDLFLRRRAAASFQWGLADAAVPVAQTVGFQGSRAGTDTNTAGADATINPSIGTGTGTPANIIVNGIVGATTGTGTQTTAAALTIAGVANGQLPSVVIGSAALATNATDGFLYIPTCAGTPTGTPTAKTGRVAMIYDTSNNKFYIYNGAWKGGTNPGAFT